MFIWIWTLKAFHLEVTSIRECQPLPQIPRNSPWIEFCLSKWSWYRYTLCRTSCCYLQYLTCLLPVCSTLNWKSTFHTDPARIVVVIESKGSHLVPGDCNGIDTAVATYMDNSLIRERQYSYFSLPPTPRDKYSTDCNVNLAEYAYSS
jgi:hypothetical protein